MADLDPFESYVLGASNEVRLAKAALLFACDEYGVLDVVAYLARLDGLAERVGRFGSVTPEEQCHSLRRVLVEECGFMGLNGQRPDPQLSYVNRVLDTKHGLPIALGAIWLDVARSLGWPLSAIGLPGHFVLRHDELGDNLFIDPFNRGCILTTEECLEIAVQFGAPLETAYAALTTPMITVHVLRRMLNNLASVYHAAGDWKRLSRTLRRIAQLAPRDPAVRLDLARSLLEAHAFSDVYGELRKLATLPLDGNQEKAYGQLERETRSRIAQLN